MKKYYFINIIMYFLPDRMPGNGKWNWENESATNSIKGYSSRECG